MSLPARLLGLLLACAACASPTRLELHLGVDADGHASAEWRAAIDARGDRAPSWAEHRLTPEEAAWLALVRARLPLWEARLAALALPFEGVEPPPRVPLLVGNQNGEDAFTLGGDVVHFDLSACVRNYGAAAEPENAARLDRFFAHEYTHVLHSRWERAHPETLDSPLARALHAMLREGLGNLRSLSEAWVAADGAPTELARTTRAELEPLLVERLARLATATEAEERELTAGLSTGPFRKKWGALPVALWLAAEARGDDRNLRPWVAAGSAGVLALARGHLAPELAARLPAAPGAAAVRSLD